MDNKQKEKINKRISSLFNITLDLIFATVKLIFLVILMIGATSSFLLYLKMYPEKGLILYNAFSGIFRVLFNILQILIGFIIGILTGWLSFNILIRILRKSKIKREQRREEFLEELSEKLKKKLKKK